MNLWQHFAKILFHVFKKEVPHLIRVKPNDNNQIIIEREKAENEIMRSYKGSGLKMDGKVVKLASDILEKRQQKVTEDKEKKRLIEWMDVISEKLGQLMQK